MNQKSNIAVILIILISGFLNECKAQNYVGSNGFGKLSILKNKTFVFYYWDCAIDSGTYTINGDTLRLYSAVPPVRIKKVNEFKPYSYYFNFVSSLNIYNSDCLLNQFKSNIDTVSMEVSISDVHFKKGNLIEFSFLGIPRNIIWQEQELYIKSCYFELDLRHGKRVYFNDYPLLIRGATLLPFDESMNVNFKLVNGFEFLPMLKGKSFKTRLSGYGEIH